MYTPEVVWTLAAAEHFPTRVVLRPTIEWDGAAPDAGTLERLHHEAHERCFIANAVRTEVVVEPTA